VHGEAYSEWREKMSFKNSVSIVDVPKSDPNHAHQSRTFSAERLLCLQALIMDGGHQMAQIKNNLNSE